MQGPDGSTSSTFIGAGVPTAWMREAIEREDKGLPPPLVCSTHARVPMGSTIRVLWRCVQLSSAEIGVLEGDDAMLAEVSGGGAARAHTERETLEVGVRGTDRGAAETSGVCRGCGATLQTASTDAPGYAARAGGVCRRCFRMTHYADRGGAVPARVFRCVGGRPQRVTGPGAVSGTGRRWRR